MPTLPMVFNLGDLICLHLSKGRFPSRRKNKLMAYGDGLFKVLKRIGDKTYKLELPGNMNVSATVNVGDLATYVKDDFENFKVNPSQDGEVDI